MNIVLPVNLQKDYAEINSHFNVIKDDWKKYNDELLPEDKIFAKRILTFIINVIDYVIDNYEKLDVAKFQEFFAYYHYNFYYGPNGDDSNYLAFDETIDGEPISEYCWTLMDAECVVTKKSLEELKKKYVLVRELF